MIRSRRNWSVSSRRIMFYSYGCIYRKNWVIPACITSEKRNLSIVKTNCTETKSGKEAKWKIFLFCVFLCVALFNLDVSPFKYVIPARPFLECPNNQIYYDTCAYLYMGNLIPQGLMPYRDAFDHKGPLLYLIMALGLQIGNIAGVWVLSIGFLLVSAYYAYKTARLLVSPWAASLATSVALLWYSKSFTSPESLSVPFLFATLYCLICYFLNGYRISKLKTLFLGACFGAVALLKVNLTVIWIIFILLFVVVSFKKREFLQFLSHTAFFLLGTVLVVAPIFIWLYVRGAFPDFVDDYWNFNLHAYGEGPTLSNYLVFFVGPCFSQWRDFYSLNLPTVVVYAVMIWRGKSPNRKKIYMCMEVAFLVSVLLSGIRNTCFRQYCFPLVIFYLLPFAVSFEFILNIAKKHIVLGVIGFLLLWVPVLPILSTPVVRDWIKFKIITKNLSEEERNKLSFPLRGDLDTLDIAMWIKKNVKTTSTLCGVDPLVYWHAKHLCASRYFLYSAPEKNSVEHFHERIFVKDKQGHFPEYVFARRKGNYIITINQILSEKSKLYPKEVEETLTEKYDVVYRNDSFELFQFKKD